MDALLSAFARRSIKPLDLAVGIALSRFADSKTGEGWPSVKTLADKVGAKVDKRGGCSRVSHAIAALKREKLIEVRQRHNRSSAYALTGGGLPAENRQGLPAENKQPNSVTRTPPLT